MSAGRPAAEQLTREADYMNSAAPRRDWPTDLGIVVVGLAAAILTFTTLRGLAQLVGFRDVLFGVLPSAWLLPVTIDAAGVVAARVWLRRLGPPAAVTFARWLTWACILGSVAGNAGAHVLAEFAITPPWWVVVLVTAVPAATLGAVVHLGTLVRTGPETGETEHEQAEPEPARETVTAGPVETVTGPVETGDRDRSETGHLDPPTVVLPAVRTGPLDRSGTGPVTGPATRTETGPDRSARPVLTAADLHGPAQPVGGPAAGKTDEELLEMLQKWADEIGSVPSRKLVMDRYKIGTGRADRLRAKTKEPARLRVAR